MLCDVMLLCYAVLCYVLFYVMLFYDLSCYDFLFHFHSYVCFFVKSCFHFDFEPGLWTFTIVGTIASPTRTQITFMNAIAIIWYETGCYVAKSVMERGRISHEL